MSKTKEIAELDEMVKELETERDTLKSELKEVQAQYEGLQKWCCKVDSLTLCTSCQDHFNEHMSDEDDIENDEG